MSPLRSVICSGSVYILEISRCCHNSPVQFFTIYDSYHWLPSSVKLIVLSLSLSIHVENDFQMLDALYQEAIMKQN